MKKKVVFALLLIQVFILGQVAFVSASVDSGVQRNRIEPQDVHESSTDDIPWGIQRVNAPAAWDTTIGSEDIVVAVLDTGIDPNHPDLKDNIWINEDEVPANGQDDDGNGYRDDVMGWNFVDETNFINDAEGHGTHVSGTIAARLNDHGLVGVAPGVKIMVLRVFNERGSDLTSVSEAIKYATNNGADIISMSLGTPSNDPSLEMQEAVDLAEENGVLMIAAAGNDNENLGEHPLYPAAYPEVVSVAAIDSNDERAQFSNYGKINTLAAPGVRVNSTFPQGEGSTSELAIDGSKYEHYSMVGANETDEDGVTADLEYLGLASETDIEGKDLTGKIALIERGEINFGEKIANAASVGAIGAIVYNNVEGLFAGALGEDGAIPAVSISRADGEALLSGLNDGQTISANIIITYGLDYALSEGTSMAAPHISGVAALIWSVDQNLVDQQVVDLMIRSAQDLGDPGRDPQFGYGVPDVALAVQAVGDNEGPTLEHDVELIENDNGTKTVRGTLSSTDNLAVYHVGYSYNNSKNSLYQVEPTRTDSITMEFEFLLPEDIGSFAMNISAIDVAGNEIRLTLDLLSSEDGFLTSPFTIFAISGVLVTIYTIRIRKPEY